MSNGLRKVCLAGPLRAGKTTLWRELTGRDARLHGFSQAPFKQHQGFSLWDSQGGCSLDSLGQVYLADAEVVLVAVAADVPASGTEAARVVAAVRALCPKARVAIALTRADLGVCVDADALAALAPVFSVVHARGPGLAELVRFATQEIPV